MTPLPGSLAARAVLAIALLAGFYLISFAIVAFLLFVPWVELAYGTRFHPLLALGCTLIAFTILVSIVPRRARFVAPGPRLDRARHPRLFDLLEGLADAAGTDAPQEVYLIGEVNAWVRERGGFLGLGGRRVLGLGLPLLHGLTVSELGGVMAHEFGHYSGGDTRLLPLAYHAHTTMRRTIDSLGGDEDRKGLLLRPFLWYSAFYMRVTKRIARAQEASADLLAASLVGPASAIEGLMKVSVLGELFYEYLRVDVDEVVRSGFRPPLGEGFARFLAAPRVQEAFPRAMARLTEVSREQASRVGAEVASYDSHPPVHERIALMEQVPAVSQPRDQEPARFLLGDLPALDRELTDTVIALGEGVALEAITWEEVPERVYRDRFLEVVTHEREVLDRFQFEELPGRWDDAIPVLGRAVLGEDAPGAPPAQVVEAAVWLIGAALASAMVARGWVVYTSPGFPILLRGPGSDIDIAAHLRVLAADPGMADVAWRERCREWGLAGRTLACAVSAP